MTLTATTRAAANSDGMKDIELEFSLDLGVTYIDCSDWFSEATPSGGQSDTSDYNYFEGPVEVLRNKPKSQQWTFKGRYSETVTTPHYNLYAYHLANTNDGVIYVKWRKRGNTTGGVEWTITAGVLGNVSPVEEMNANSATPNLFTMIVQGVAVQSIIGA